MFFANFQRLLVLTALFFTQCSSNVIPVSLTVAIISTNDIHGHAFPTSQVRADNGEQYEEGGLPVMAHMIRTIQSEYEGRSLYLDAGDQLQGGVQSRLTKGEIVLDFFDRTNLDASVIGNHQFDFGKQFLHKYLATKKHPTLGANIIFPKEALPNVFPSKLFKLPSYNLSIGVIGLTTIETLSTTPGFIDGSFQDYQVLHYRGIVQEEAAKLRKEGANAVLIVGHVGNQCSFNQTYGIWEDGIHQQPCLDDEITNLLDFLPPGTINGVIQGHRHTFSHHFHRGVPIMGSNIGGKHFNVMYLQFQDKKIVGSKIEGPIPVCQKIFRQAKQCKWVSPDKLFYAGDLINWNFHGKEVQQDEVLQKLYEHKYFPLLKEYLVPLCNSEVYLEKSKIAETTLMNLFLGLIHAAVPQLQIIIFNPGSLRAEWPPGIIRLQNLYDMSPFDSSLMSISLLGSTLIKVLTIIQNGHKGLYGVYGVKQTLEIDSNHKKKFVSAVMQNGKQIDENATYQVGLSEFLFNGGDDFIEVVKKGLFQNTKPKNIGQIRNFIRQGLIETEVIKQRDWIDPNNPNLNIIRK